MRWPWQPPAPPPPERREAGPYTDAVVRLLMERATGAAAADAAATGAFEAAAGLYSRSFASATLTIDGAPAVARIAPGALAAIARDLVSRGETVLVRVGGAVVKASQWTIAGKDADPDRWQYSVQVPVPDGQVMIHAPGAALAHPRYASDPATPWRGVSPLERAKDAAILLGNLEKRAGEEAGGAVGYLLPIPTDPNDATVASLKDDLAKLNGKTAIVETTAGGWGEGRPAAPQADWRPQRIGMQFAPPIPEMYRLAQNAVLSALGVPIELIHPADGTGAREAFRRFLHGSLAPLGAIVADELSKIMGGEVAFDWSDLFASDIAGRARAFQSMVAAGMDPAAAAANSGLMNDAD